MSHFKYVPAGVIASLLFALPVHAGPSQKTSKKFGNNLSNCSSKQKIQRGYVAQGAVGQTQYFGFNCYDKRDGKDEGGLFYFSKRYHGDAEPAPGVFRNPDDCRKANESYSKYTDRVDQLVHKGKIKKDSLEAHDYAVRFCTAADGFIHQISFERPPEKDRLAYEQEKKAYQEEEKAKLKKDASASGAVEGTPASAGEARP